MHNRCLFLGHLPANRSMVNVICLLSAHGMAIRGLCLPLDKVACLNILFILYKFFAAPCAAVLSKH
jgi:hypothetical protein